MTYVLLDETNQTYSLPPINKDNICNYNLDTKQLEKDGYTNITDNEKELLDSGKGKIVGVDIIDISNTDIYKSKKALEIQALLIEQNYRLKASIAYTGALYDHEVGGVVKELVFQTNATSTPLIASTFIAFTKENSNKESISWKFWTTKETINYPVFVTLSKEQFLKFYDFAEDVINSAVNIEAEYNAKIQTSNVEDLINEDKIKLFIEEMTNSYSRINTKITLE